MVIKFANNTTVYTESKIFYRGDILSREGEVSEAALYLILEGNCSAYKTDGELEIEFAEFSGGDFFGEVALISPKPNKYTIKVKSEALRVLSFSKERILELAAQKPGMVFAILKTVIVRLLKAEAVTHEIISDISRVKLDLIEKLHEYKIKIHHPAVRNYIRDLPQIKLGDGKNLYSPNSPSPGKMYYLEKGSLQVERMFNKQHKVSVSIPKGTFFAETFLVNNHFSPLHVYSNSQDTVVKEIDRESFFRLCTISPLLYFNFLKFVIWKLNTTEKVQQYLETRLNLGTEQPSDILAFTDKEIVVEEGEPSNDCMYFLLKGQCNVLKNTPERRVHVNTLYPGDFFGELALISREPRNATIQAIGKEVTLIPIAKKNFIRKTAENPDFMFSFVKATIARLYKAETLLFKQEHTIKHFDPLLTGKLEQARINNLNFFSYLFNIDVSISNRGEKIYSESDASDKKMYFLLSGSLAVTKKYGNNNLEVNTLEAGDFFGEVSLVSPLSRTHSVIVLSDIAELAVFDLEALMKAIQAEPKILYILLTSIIWKLILTEKSISGSNLDFNQVYKKS